jgi:type 1 glutamine amidotransferase/major membrane immunogen (membrane-anchored lipoprotein)
MKSIPANPVRRFVLITVTLLSFYSATAQQRLLVFSKTAGYRHSSISNGISAIQQIGAANGFEVVTTENAGDFNANYLAGFNAVVFLSTTGDILDNNQQAAFEQYIKSGGGYVGVHAATDCEYSWPWYGQLVGAWFNGHPDIQPATLNVINTTHPSTSSLPASWQRTDEWYNFGNFQSAVNTLIRIDENSYTGGTMGNNHPIAWYHDFDGGRSWYTALGHTDASFSEASFLSHLAGGINYALGSGTVNAAPTANAGADQTITLPQNSVSLNGSGNDPDGTITSYEWTKLSGPAGGNISSAGTAATDITNLQQGVYVYRLTVMDDDNATATNDVQITVNAAVVANLSPAANAGADQTITLPQNSVSLNGSGNDPDGTIVSYAWTKLSGPAGGNISSAGTAATDITNLQQGVYVYRLTVKDDDDATATNDVQITVNAALVANLSPTANAGADQTITLPQNSVSLNGSGNDPDGTIISYEWTKLSGPAGGNISSAGTAATDITNLQQGVYVYRLTVKDDDDATASNDIQVTVNAAVINPNIKPKADAGTDISITLPVNSVTLNGNGSDDDGIIDTYTWSKISGPASGGGAIQDASSASTGISSLNEGTYVFRLSVKDNDGDTGTDDITVTVNAPVVPPNIDPVAYAGADRSITLPVNTTNLAGSGKDDDGNIIKYNWIKVSGPVSGGGSIQSQGSPVTNINGLNEGNYVYRLTVTDNKGATATDEVQIKVNTVAGPNELPTAFAGTDLVITLPVNTVTLTGSGNDADGVIVSYSWLKISGPSTGGGSVQKPVEATTNILNLKEGTYVFRFMVTDDNGAKTYDEVKIKVNPSASSLNKAPVAVAGEDVTITLPTSYVTLNGSNSSDADGSIQSWEWKKMAGPVAGLLSGGNTSKLQLSSLAAGEYDFRLIVTDNFGASDTDDVKLLVIAPNELPVINLKDTFYVTLPVRNTLLDAGNSTDPDGTISQAKWTFVKGPSKPFMISPDSIATIVTELVAGTYDFNLSITDDRGGITKGKTTVVVKNSGTRRIIPKMRLYPNPSREFTTLTIDAEIDGRADVTIYDLHGRPVQHTIFNKTGQVLQARLLLDNLAKGMYMVEVVIERAEKVVLKLVRH